MSKYRVDPDDVAKAVAFLEESLDDMAMYELGRIKNPDHAISPRGEGFGVLVRQWYYLKHPAPGSEPRMRQVWEKCGDGRSAYTAAVACVDRLRVEMLAAIVSGS